MSGLIELLRELCQRDGVSGMEDDVRDCIRGRIEKHADQIVIDKLGNLLVFKKGRKSGAERIMLAAHMDEVGLIVKTVTSDGYLKFGACGGIDRRVLIGKRVLVGRERVPGIIALRAFHLTNSDERAGVPRLEDLYIDIGARDKEDALMYVSLGDYCAFDSEPCTLGDKLIKAKAIDDRLGCAVLVSLIEETPPVDAWFAFTVQEEVGLRGATVAAARIAPEIAVIVEGTTAADSPDLDRHRRVCSVGGGAVVPFMDRGSIYDRGLLSELAKVAKSRGIKTQTKNYVSGGTDAAAIQRSLQGVPVAAVAAPVRNIHSPSCVASVDDCQAVLDLVREFLIFKGGQ